MTTATMDRPATAAPARTTPALSLTLPRSVLREALGKLLSVIPTSKVSMPIASCVLIEVPEVSGDGASLTGTRAAAVQCSATDFETMLTLAIPAEVTGAGRFAVPAKRLADFVASLPTAARVGITLTGLTVTVRAGRAVYECPAMDPSDFPTAPVIDAGPGDPVPAAAFLDAISRAARFASAEESRPILNAVCLDAADGALVAFATSKYAAALLPIASCTAPRQTLLRRVAVGSIVRMFGDSPADAVLTIRADEHRARIDGSAGSMVLQLVAGPYPKYRQLLAQTPAHTITCDRVELAGAVKRVALASNDVGKVIMSIAPATGLAAGSGASELTLRASSDKAGTAEDTVAIEMHDQGEHGADEFQIGASATLLGVALDGLTDARVTLSFTTPSQAFLLRNASQAAADPTLTLVMPLRIDA